MIDVVTGEGFRNAFVSLGGESAFEIEEFLLAAVSGGEEVGEGGSGLNLHSDGVPILGAMALDGASEQELLPRPPLLRWILGAGMVFHVRLSQPLQTLCFVFLGISCFKKFEI